MDNGMKVGDKVYYIDLDWSKDTLLEATVVHVPTNGNRALVQDSEGVRLYFDYVIMALTVDDAFRKAKKLLAATEKSLRAQADQNAERIWRLTDLQYKLREESNEEL